MIAVNAKWLKWKRDREWKSHESEKRIFAIIKLYLKVSCVSISLPLLNQ